MINYNGVTELEWLMDVHTSIYHPSHSDTISLVLMQRKVMVAVAAAASILMESVLHYYLHTEIGIQEAKGLIHTEIIFSILSIHLEFENGSQCDTMARNEQNYQYQQCRTGTHI